MTTINALPVEEIKYVKTISFHVEYFGRLYTAKIVYMRNLSPNYMMNGSKRTPIDEFLCHYPEACYPSDTIDELILMGVMEKYPSAKINVNTRLMYFDVERDELIKELNLYTKLSFTIMINPRIDDIDLLLRSGKTQWRCFQKILPLYLTNSNETDCFRYDGCSVINYELDREEELIKLEPKLLNEVTFFSD